MGFGDLKTREGQQVLNNYLADRSYIHGFEPSDVDNVVFEALGVAPPGDLFNALRFFNHINSFTEAERKAFRSSGKSVNDFGTGGETKTAEKKEEKAEDDDDIDLFGSDAEEDAEAARIREERVAAYAAKKSKKPALVAKSCVKLDIKPWDDETDLNEMQKLVKSIEMEGLVWGQCKSRFTF